MRHLKFLPLCGMVFFCLNSSAQDTIQTENMELFRANWKNSPIGHQAKKNPENFKHMNHVDVYHMNYKSDGLKVTGFLAKPKEAGNYPIILFNRGGNRNYGQLLIAHAVDVLGKFANEGYIVAATNYRGNSGSEGKEEFGGADVKDIYNLAQCMQELTFTNSEKIGLFGVSRGAMMNYIALRKWPDLFSTSVQIGGISDLELTAEHHPEIESVMKDLIPDYTTNRDAAVAARSAINWVSELPKIPLLILHGNKDQHVYYDQSVQLADSLDYYHLNYQLVTYYKDNHGIVKHKSDVEERILNWFNTYLKEEKQFTVDKNRVLVK